MIRFTNDYSQGCHPSILEALQATNLEGNFGYSMDPHTEHARQLIRQAIGRPDADVHLLVGGTQANATAISAFLRPHEAVIAAESGHICTHETGAVEATGHKCIACPSPDGKLTPAAIRAAVAAHPNEHTVKPAMVYISQTTEVVTLYRFEELAALRAICDELGLILFIDGARLGSALAAGAVTLPQMAQVADAFYIGGTKNGALFGEAMVLLNEKLKPDFRYLIKRHGGMLAKGWLLGIQFETLMQGGLYEDLARHANTQALRLRDGAAALGIPFATESISNQQFLILPDEVAERLARQVSFEVSGKPDGGHTIARFVTSWATDPADVDTLLEILRGLL